MGKLTTNIGDKVKTLALIVLLAGSLLSIIASIILYNTAYDPNIALLLIGIIGGPLVSYISFIFLYAFGELVETNQQIARNTSK